MQQKLLKEVPMPTTASNFLLYSENIYKEEEIIIDNEKVRKTVVYRNVSDKNKESAIQFVVQEYNKKTNRNKLISFSIPYEAMALFIEHISNPAK